MKQYLVGGAVRDVLMGMEPKDRDYVVVGSSVEEMLAAGFEKVGADFPVFLHSYTKEEHALARREKKTGSGYLGFTSEFGPDVTLAEDLGRRDLTINAMAIPETRGPVDTLSVLIDPFNGYQDIQNKVLRHTSDAFAEDPVRVLRLARFRARYGSEWTVAPETQQLVAKMAKKGVLAELTAERVWKELSRALMEPHARLFFDTLLECDALNAVFPEIFKLVTAPEPRLYHPEGNAYEHTMLVLTQAVKHNFDLETRFACLVHDFGKGLTPADLLPNHHGHEVVGVPVVEQFCFNLTVPARMRENAVKVSRYHMYMHLLEELNNKTLVRMFMDTSAFNHPDFIDVLYRVGVCDARGRLGAEESPVTSLLRLHVAYDAARATRFVDVFPAGETNVTKIKEGMYRARIKNVAVAIKEHFDFAA
jgi:tRNA nucleotidyltransferase (CCA-adding enzyme)